MIRKIAPWIHVLVALPLLFAAFSVNLFETANADWFRNHQRGPEGQIAGRMVISRRDGFFSHAGFNGECRTMDRKFHFQDEIYLEERICTIYTPYISQTGMQALSAAAFDALTGFSRARTWSLLHLITALFSAIFVGLLLAWIGREFGHLAFASALLSTLASPWMTVYGRNLYWMMGVFYLPILSVIWLLDRELRGRALSRRGAVLTIAGGVLFKCLFSGYEFMTTTLIMMMVPLVYVAWSQRWPSRRFLETGLWFSGAALLGVLLSAIILVAQIASLKGGVTDGVAHIAESFERRTYGNADELPGMYRTSLEIGTLEVVSMYLNGTAFGHARPFDGPRPETLDAAGRFTYRDFIYLLILTSAIALGLVKRLRGQGARHDRLEALLISSWFAFLAPLSWFVIFKAHSYIHTHVNFLTWHLPFVPLGAALLGYLISLLWDREVRARLAGV